MMMEGAAWPTKPSSSMGAGLAAAQPQQGQGQGQGQQQPPAPGPLVCGVGALEGPAGARSRCAREEGMSALCDCGRHTFLLSSGAASAAATTTAASSRRQDRKGGSENRPPAAQQPPPQHQPHTEDIENISRSMVQAMSATGRGGGSSDCKGGGVAAPSAPSSSPPPQQQQQQQQQASQHHHQQGHGKRPSLSGGGSGRDGSGSGSELPLDRIVVEPNGDMVVVEPSVVCDACPACDDVCPLAGCRGCAEKRARLVARGQMCLLDAQGRRLIRESSSADSGPAGCVPRIGKPRTPSSSGSGAASGAGSGHTSASASAACYTLCEIRRHRTLASCWLVAKGQVYDATKYLSSHPAGAIAIARKAGGGVDCAEDLEFHSGRAQKLWKHLRIGAVVACPSEACRPPPSCGPLRGAAATYPPYNRREGSSSLVGSSCSIM